MNDQQMWIYSALKARNWGWKTGALFPPPPKFHCHLHCHLPWSMMLKLHLNQICIFAQALAVKKLWVLPLALLDFCSVMYVWPCWNPKSTKKRSMILVFGRVAASWLPKGRTRRTWFKPDLFHL